jgi:hypothetical protein
VWKRLREGTWKVAADFGIKTVGEAAPLGRQEVEVSSRDARIIALGGLKGGAAGAAMMKKLDTKLSAACSTAGLAAAYDGVLDGTSRVHRMQVLPVVGREAIRAWLANDSSVVVWSPSGAGVARAGDLGYTYGAYDRRLSARSPAVVEKGYYLHVWSRSRSGSWKLVADVANQRERTD